MLCEGSPFCERSCYTVKFNGFSLYSVLGSDAFFPLNSIFEYIKLSRGSSQTSPIPSAGNLQRILLFSFFPTKQVTLIALLHLTFFFLNLISPGGSRFPSHQRYEGTCFSGAGEGCHAGLCNTGERQGLGWGRYARLSENE